MPRSRCRRRGPGHTRLMLLADGSYLRAQEQGEAREIQPQHQDRDAGQRPVQAIVGGEIGSAVLLRRFCTSATHVWPRLPAWVGLSGTSSQSSLFPGGPKGHGELLRRFGRVPFCRRVPVARHTRVSLDPRRTRQHRDLHRFRVPPNASVAPRASFLLADDDLPLHLANHLSP